MTTFTFALLLAFVLLDLTFSTLRSQQGIDALSLSPSLVRSRRHLRTFGYDLT
jgi:hypothetical protein